MRCAKRIVRLMELGMNKQELVSIIVPIYNAETTLEQALSSIEQQSYPHFEALCVNDGSTDNSQRIIDAWCTRDARFKAITKENGGYGSACNCGLQRAQGTWIGILEPDDWYDAHFLEHVLALQDCKQEHQVAQGVAQGESQNTAHNAERDAAHNAARDDILKAAYWRVTQPDTSEQAILACSYRKRVHVKHQPFTIYDSGATELLNHHPSIWSALYRRAFLQENAITFPEIPGAGWADNPFLFETFLAAKRIRYCDEPLYFYREETETKTRSFAQNSTFIPLDRLRDIFAILTKRNEKNYAVLCSVYHRVFFYIAGLCTYNNISENKRLKSAITDIFKKLHPAIVFSIDSIEPRYLKLYCELTGEDTARIHYGRYLVYLLRESVYSARNIGIKVTMKRAFAFLHKRSK